MAWLWATLPLIDGFQFAFLACMGFAIAAALTALLVIRESVCQDCIAAHIPTEHHHFARPFAIYLGQLVAPGEPQKAIETY